MRLRDINLEDLRAQHEHGEPFEVASQVMATYSEPRLQRLLRHHREGTVTGADVDRRDAFDQVLGYYAFMEVAAVASYIPVHLPESYRAAALAFLTNKHVKKYYEDHYPLLLPMLHRERLRGSWKGSDDEKTSAPCFTSFTELNRIIEEDEDVETFLWFLEDGSIDDYSLEDLLEIVADPARFAEAVGGEADSKGNDAAMWAAIRSEAGVTDPDALLRRFKETPREASPAESALRGLRTFLFFARDFDLLLRATEDAPLLQSAMWHYHAYWFDELSDDLGSYLSQVVDRFAAWDVEGEAPEWVEQPAAAADEARVDRFEGAAELKAAIARLTSRQYGRTLRTAFTVSRPSRARTRSAVAIASVAAAGVAAGGAVLLRRAAASRKSAGRKPASTSKRAAAKSTKRKTAKAGAKSAARKRAAKKPSAGKKARPKSRSR